MILDTATNITEMTVMCFDLGLSELSVHWLAPRLGIVHRAGHSELRQPGTALGPLQCYFTIKPLGPLGVGH
jgi:hypothetical protein